MPWRERGRRPIRHKGMGSDSKLRNPAPEGALVPKDLRMLERHALIRISLERRAIKACPTDRGARISGAKISGTEISVVSSRTKVYGARFHARTGEGKCPNVLPDAIF